jgi:bacterial/archaeal transporter family protein
MSEMPIQANWVPWALMSAVFAALTAIFAKVGLEGVDSDIATLIRTFVIVAAVFAVVFLGERPVARDWLGITLVAVGVVLLALKGR